MKIPLRSWVLPLKMFTKMFFVLLAGALASRCVFSVPWSSVNASAGMNFVNQDIKFPRFQDSVAVDVMQEDVVFRVDGASLQALRIATDDYLSAVGGKVCGKSLPALRYRIVRKMAVFFVSVEEDPALCGVNAVALDSGARYAIGLDGHILRRLFDGEPDGTETGETRGASTEEDGGVSSPPGTSRLFEQIKDDPARWAVPQGLLDGGISPAVQSVPALPAASKDGGSSTVP